MSQTIDRAHVRRRHVPLFVSSLLVAVLVAAGFFSVSGPSSARSAFASDSEETESVVQTLPSFKEVARRIGPAVVHIESVRNAVPTEGRSVPRIPDSLREFFGDVPFDWSVPRIPEMIPPRPGVGSGFIVQEDGVILTNAHVVRGANELRVTLDDGSRHDAKVVGVDDKSDVAVLRIDAEGLPVAPLGDSDAVEVGEWVLALGSPFGLSKTVTAGIISATGRYGVGIVDYEDFLQTDADINPGNSGGPLVNLRGEVVGVNTAILSRTGTSSGVGFAIPANLARSVLDNILETGTVRRGFLGVNIQDLNADLAGSFGFEGTDGALIADVGPKSPAERAGLEAGDIVTGFDGEAIDSVHELRNRVAATAPGTTVRLEVFRDGKTVKRKVVLGELESTSVVSPDGAAPSGKTGGAQLGMTLEPLTPALAAQAGLDIDAGLLVTSVERDSAAARAGIRAGDVLLGIGGKSGGKDVAATKDLSAALAEIDADEDVLVRVYRDGFRRFVVLKRAGD